MLARLSLRARLVLGVIVLGAIGLAVADVATYASLRSFLIDRTDASLEQSHGGIEHELERSGCGAEDGRPPPGVDPGDFVQVRTAQGAVVCSWQLTPLGESAPSPPALPETIEPSGDGSDQASFFTVPAKDGDGRYRVRASTEPRTGATLITATPLTDVDATLRRLLGIMLLVTAAVLAALAALGLWVVGIGLRPLDEIGTTAAAIAGGDLTRRVERAEPRTEVGRLGLALNAMLAQIEAAFEAQAASERRLRRFVADASHELRTPLAAVRAYAELFGRGANRRPDDLERAMTGISRESERMTLLVEDLLLLARLAVVEVSDSGPGMTSDEAARAFERFYRSDTSRSRATGGVGLGLSIVAAVTEAHGGAVSAHSTPGDGATFRITFPRNGGTTDD
jgi:two-component system OmpR family sensor kinase